MQLQATQIRVGMILLIEKQLYRVVWTMHRTPGKGNACMQTKLKHVQSGKNLEKRFLSSERVEKASLETIDQQYLYAEPDSLVFMDLETFEQQNISKDIIGDGLKFLKEGETYPITIFDGQCIGIDLPNTIELKVTYAPPEIKKATATSSLRPVELENGLTIQAPGFIKENDIIKVNIETLEYLERVNG